MLVIIKEQGLFIEIFLMYYILSEYILSEYEYSQNNNNNFINI